VAGLDLVTERVDRLRTGPDPHQPGVDDLLGEAGVLGEEAVAGVDGVRAGLLGDLDELVLQQVGVTRRRAAQRIRLIGDGHVEGVPVGLGIDGHGRDPVVLAGAGDTDGDLATVGDEDFAEGHGADAIGCPGAVRPGVPVRPPAGDVCGGPATAYRARPPSLGP
jgi:hypothetical protein